MVGWVRSAVSPQRRGIGAGLMNPRTWTRPPIEEYAPAITHWLSSLPSARSMPALGAGRP